MKTRQPGPNVGKTGSACHKPGQSGEWQRSKPLNKTLVQLAQLVVPRKVPLPVYG